MTEVDFYNDLMDETPETIVLHGLVLMNKNQSKWHLCKKGLSRISHACGNGSPSNPNRGDFSRGSFERSTELVQPIEALEQGRLCSFCENIIKKEFEYEQVAVAVGDSEQEDLDRFLARRDEVLEDQ